MTKSDSLCPECGLPLHQATLGGLCPRCVTRRTLSDVIETPSVMPVALRVLQRFGDYELVEEIARGGMGVVYRAHQLSLGRKVAIKLMRDGALATDHDVHRFLAEAESAASLQHPGIVAIHEVGEHEGQYFLCMELIDGCSLAEATRDGPLPSRQAAEVLAAVADAVQHAHDRGILHRDLKPSNVLLDNAGQPHVTDYGLAKRMGGDSDGKPDPSPIHLTMSGQILGTPGYMAPEQASGRHRDVSPSSDTYSLGALLYHAMTGVAPFTGESPAVILRQIEERDPPCPRLLNPSIPADLETICLKALSKDAPGRYASARAFAEDLRRWLKGEPIQARPITRLERAWRWSRRNPAVALFAASTLVLLFAISVGSLLAARRIEISRRAEVAGRSAAEERLRQGERLLDFLLGDLYTRLDHLGRLEVLESTIAEVDRFYEKLPTNSLSSEAVRHHARAQLLQGYIRGSQGRPAEARASYDSALKLYQRAVQAQPTNSLWLHEHAQAWNSLAVWEHTQGSPAGAEHAYREALRRTAVLIKTEPQSDDWLDSHASISHNFGAFLDMIGRLDEAEQTYTEVLSHWRALLQRRPNLPDVMEHLAQLYQNLAFVQDKRGHPDQATESNHQALELRQELVARDPKNMTWLSQLADIQQNIAERHLRLGNLRDAEAWTAKYRPIREHLAAHDPANAIWQLRLAEAWRNWASILASQGNDSGALQAYQRARERSSHGSSAGRDGQAEGMQREEELHLRLALRAQEAGDATGKRQHEDAAASLRATRSAEALQPR